MKKLFILFVFTVLFFNSKAQNYVLISGQGWLNNNSSVITETTNYGLLLQKKKINSYGLAVGGGMRMSNLFGFELGVGYLNQKWNYSDNTISYFTNGLSSNSFKNSMKMAQFNLGFHKVFQRNDVNFAYTKLGIDLNFIKTGTYRNDDPSGTGPQRIYNGTYTSGIAMYANPEIGVFLKSNETSEISLFAAYKIGLSSPFDLNYTLDGGGDFAEYNISGKGNRTVMGVKYTYKIALNDEKKVKTPKPAKEPKEKEPKPVKEPKEKEPKPEKTKELKIDKDGVPKTLNDREIVKSKTIYVESEEIIFRVWDSGKEVDGDTISLNLSGEWILQSFGLTRDKHEVVAKIKLDGKNFLMLYALNLGKYPPNTAAVSVWDGKTEQILELKSDLKSCGSLNIVYRPK